MVNEVKNIHRGLVLGYSLSSCMHAATIALILSRLSSNSNYASYEYASLDPGEFISLNVLMLGANLFMMQSTLTPVTNPPKVIYSPLDPTESRLAGGPRPTPRPGSTRSSHLEMLAKIDGERARRIEGSTPDDVLGEVLKYKRPEVAGRIVEAVYAQASQTETLDLTENA